MARLIFELLGEDAGARAGLLTFKNGPQVETPVFMPVGTRASVKAIRQETLEKIGYRLILGNTYHLYLRPGTEVFNKFSGIKNYMAWPHAVLTDSGGYQAFSLSEFTRYKDDGVEFRSHLDGSRHLFTPEKVLDIQADIKSDIFMPIDDCAPYPAEKDRLQASLERTHQWLKQSVDIMHHKGYSEDHNLFAIAQGGADPGLRKVSAEFISQFDLPGYAIGGLSVGEKGDEFRQAIEVQTELLPRDKPRYLMGVGSVPEIIDAVMRGVDMFDCVLPTRNARNGQVFTSQGKVNLRNEKHAFSDRPIDEQCNCSVCNRYSIGYLRHLHKMKEILAFELSTEHNLYFMFHFMKNMRMAIINGNFSGFATDYKNLF